MFFPYSRAYLGAVFGPSVGTEATVTWEKTTCGGSANFYFMQFAPAFEYV